MTQYLPAFKGLSLLSVIYRRLLPPDSRYRVENFDGNIKLDVNVAETIGVNLWHAPRLYERKERELFCSWIKPGNIVLDVGANIGIYTLIASKRGARVFAIEADPCNTALLRQHLRLNGFADSVTVFEVAAVDRQQSLILHRNPINSGGTSLYGLGETISVVGRTIDSLDLPPIDLCKIDIEGAELDALHGMEETLKRSRNMKLLVECSAAFNQSRLVDFLRKRFKYVEIVGAKKSEIDYLPKYCNLWAYN